ncbi:MAG TPA: hypothetical protein VER03_08235 [Bryobacteraceae bacterium]|nr:hypothetical protein [Bryobacteraceae bacterium]
MQTHVKVLAILHIVFGSLGLLFAVFLVVLFGGITSVIGMSAGPEERFIAMPIVGGIGLLIAGFAALLSIPSIVAGVGLLSYRPWARILTLVISALDLINIPFGTALGFYGFWVLLSAEGTQLFQQAPASYGYTRG